MMRSTVLLAVIALAVGCGCANRQVVVDDTGNKAAVKTEGTGRESSVKVEGKDTKVEISQTPKKPGGWPDDIAFYPGSRVEGSMTSCSKDGQGITVVLTSGDSVDDVIDYYVDELKRLDWDAEESLTTSTGKDKSAVLMAKKDKRTGTIVIGPDDAADRISIAISVTTQ